MSCAEDMTANVDDHRLQLVSTVSVLVGSVHKKSTGDPEGRGQRQSQGVRRTDRKPSQGGKKEGRDLSGRKEIEKAREARSMQRASPRRMAPCTFYLSFLLRITSSAFQAVDL